MVRAQRQQSIDSFQTDPNITILLVSIKSGGTGLNLVAANHVMITDLWWNSAVEQQVCMYLCVVCMYLSEFGRCQPHGDHIHVVMCMCVCMHACMYVVVLI